MSKISTKMKRHVKHELKEEGPTIWVGKEGLKSTVLAEVERQLQKEKMVKIRILRSALSSTDTAKVIATRTAEQVNAALVEVRGHVFIIYRRKRKPETGETAAK